MTVVVVVVATVATQILFHSAEAVVDVTERHQNAVNISSQRKAMRRSVQGEDSSRRSPPRFNSLGDLPCSLPDISISLSPLSLYPPSGLSPSHTHTLHTPSPLSLPLWPLGLIIDSANFRLKKRGFRLKKRGKNFSSALLQHTLRTHIYLGPLPALLPPAAALWRQVCCSSESNLHGRLPTKGY